jgi:hypothetical protein
VPLDGSRSFKQTTRDRDPVDVWTSFEFAFANFSWFEDRLAESVVATSLVVVLPLLWSIAPVHRGTHERRMRSF